MNLVRGFVRGFTRSFVRGFVKSDTGLEFLMIDDVFLVLDGDNPEFLTL